MTDEKKEKSPGASLSPYELVFGSAIFEEDRFPAIQEEAAARGVAPELPERFLLLGTVGALLQELLPEGTGSEEFARHGALLYQAYHFWRHGKPHFDIGEPYARRLVEEPPKPEHWHLEPPGPAGYLQLPRHLFWARIDEGATPEPVDGFFWTVAGPPESGETGSRRLELVLTLGLFPGRHGFSTISVETEIDRSASDTSIDLPARAEEPEFANILPGGELQGWYGLITDLEVLKLVSRIFRELAERTESD
jgi:hypothetical protein